MAFQHTELFLERQRRLDSPYDYVSEDYDAVYNRGEVFVGWPDSVERMFSSFARENTVLILGAEFGDEGKGRIVDNKIEYLLDRGVKTVNVVRFQGGSNSGHTLETDTGKRIPLHQVPSGILYEESVGIMDRGMIVNMEDLRVEIEDAEKLEEVGDLRGKLILSNEAMLSTDLERAQEVLNRKITEGKSSGGTGKGIATTAANALTRRGFRVQDLFEEEWEEKFEKMYDTVAAEFKGLDEDIADFEVPDLRTTREDKEPRTRKIGSRKEFIERLGELREWYIQRDNSVSSNKKLIQNTFLYHGNIYNDLEQGILFEGAQAIGLHPVYGRYPDVTSTHTDANAVMLGTQFPGYAQRKIAERIGVMKLTYTSSVGSVHMLTDSGLKRKIYTDEEIENIQNPDKQFAAWVRKEAREYGTTTGRPRDICFKDLPTLRYNAAVGGIEMLAGTHLDIARADRSIKVCTHYTDIQGRPVPFQPGIEHQKNVVPHYIDLPGWDGEEARRARSFDELPENAKKFLAFLQRNTGVPIVMVTNGPKRSEMIEFENYKIPAA